MIDDIVEGQITGEIQDPKTIEGTFTPLSASDTREPHIIVDTSPPQPPVINSDGSIEGTFTPVADGSHGDKPVINIDPPIDANFTVNNTSAIKGNFRTLPDSEIPDPKIRVIDISKQK